MVKAYSQNSSRPAIDAISETYVIGAAYYVNAYISPLSTTADTDILIHRPGEGARDEAFEQTEDLGLLFDGDDADDEAEGLRLPANYACFAFTTGNDDKEKFNLYADMRTATGLWCDYRVIDTYADNDPDIPSLKTGSTRVKLRLPPTPGKPSATERQKRLAKFTATAYNLRDYDLIAGGFRYYTGIDDSGEPTGDPVPVAWTNGSSSTKVGETGNNALEANTLYYLTTYIKVDAGQFYRNPPGGDDQIFESAPVAFSTLPEITSGTAVGEAGIPTAALVTSAFSGGTEGIASVKVYCGAVNETSIVVIPGYGTASPGGAYVSSGVTPASSQTFDETGFTNMEITGLTPGKRYNIAIEITNKHDDKDAYILPDPYWAGDASLEVSVPVKMIFAAFRSGGGEITSPVYRIKTSARFPIKVSLAKFVTVQSAGGLTLTATENELLDSGEFNLKLTGVGGTAAQDTGLIPLDVDIAADAGVGLLGTFGGPAYSSGAPYVGQCDFKITGLYKYDEGDFPETPMRPEYAAVFRFELKYE
jgi:hypothetical protein